MGALTRAPMDRWVAVIAAFLDRDDWGVRDLAAHLGLSPSVVHRILHEMQRNGLASVTEERGHFRVGPELVRLSVLIAEGLDVRRIARPTLEATAAAIDETVILALYSPIRHQFWAVDAAESTHTIRYIWESLRTWSDLYRGSSGLAILAFLESVERESLIVERPTAEQGRLRERIARVRHDGYAISHGERFAGAVGVAAPIFDATGQVIGDLIASWPDNRTSGEKEARVTAAVVAAARRVSQALGHRPTEGSGHEDASVS